MEILVNIRNLKLSLQKNKTTFLESISKRTEIFVK